MKSALCTPVKFFQVLFYILLICMPQRGSAQEKCGVFDKEKIKILMSNSDLVLHGLTDVVLNQGIVATTGQGNLKYRIMLITIIDVYKSGGHVLQEDDKISVLMLDECNDCPKYFHSREQFSKNPRHVIFFLANKKYSFDTFLKNKDIGGISKFSERIAELKRINNAYLISFPCQHRMFSPAFGFPSRVKSAIENSLPSKGD